MHQKYARWQKIHIEKAMKTRRVLLLNGGRQCGKTTLAKELISHDTTYRSLDDLALREFAQNDPHGFVVHPGKTLIIDEIQRAPNLLSAIKKMVDEDNRPGQYLLTGSANIQSLPTTTESLAGRVHKIRLRPLTQGEILGKSPLFLSKMFGQSFKDVTPSYDREQILQMAFRGGFPEPVRLDEKDRKDWYKDYITSLLERDLQDITKIHRQDSMRQLIEILAAWSSKLMDISAIQSGLSIQRQTVESYINALEALYLVERIKPWIKTDYARVGKQTKFFMTDCGLMSSILNWNIDQVRFDSDRAGKLIETFIFNELSAQIDANNNEYQLFHYRDREQREIDFLVEDNHGSLLGIEVKAGSTISAHDFRHMSWFKNNLAKERSFIGIILYTGAYPISYGDNMWAVPISNLWS